MGARPGPIFGALDKACSQCIRLDVAEHRQQVSIVLNNEVLVPPLVDVTVPVGPVFRVVVAHMSIGQPTHVGRKFNARKGPENQMPMIFHHAESENSHGRPIFCLGE
jgi:hypothetical protein